MTLQPWFGVLFNLGVVGGREKAWNNPPPKHTHTKNGEEKGNEEDIALRWFLLHKFVDF